MKILVAGDTHGDVGHVEHLIHCAKANGCDTIVQVGDFGYWPHMDKFDQHVNKRAARADVQFYWLDGNHENFDALEKIVDMDAAEPQQMHSNLWYLARGCTWTWDGCTFMALGGAYSIDKPGRIEGRSWWSQELITREQAERSMDRGPIDVLLTHDAPLDTVPIISEIKDDYPLSKGNRKAISAVVEAVKPKLLIHGHYHHAYVTVKDDVTVVGLDCNGTRMKSYTILDTERWRSDEAS